MSLVEEVLTACATLDELVEVMVQEVRRWRRQGYSVHHVAGPISADGDEHIPRNIAELQRQRSRLQAELGDQAIVISSPSVFTAAVYKRLQIFELPREQREIMLRNFWDKLIEACRFDGIHIVPGYQRSPGSLAEHQAAEKHGTPIYYLNAGNDA